MHVQWCNSATLWHNLLASYYIVAHYKCSSDPSRYIICHTDLHYCTCMQLIIVVLVR